MYLSERHGLVGARELREKLASYTRGSDAVILGTPISARAILVPIPQGTGDFGERHREACREARRRFEIAMTRVEGL